MTLLWFFVWLIWDLVGDEEPLTFDPVNWWAGSLLFVDRRSTSALCMHALKGAGGVGSAGERTSSSAERSSCRLEDALARVGGFVGMDPTIAGGVRADRGGRDPRRAVVRPPRGRPRTPSSSTSTPDDALPRILERGAVAAHDRGGHRRPRALP